MFGERVGKVFIFPHPTETGGTIPAIGDVVLGFFFRTIR